MAQAQIRLTNREDDQKIIELVERSTEPDPAVLQREGRKVYKVVKRRQITLGAACDREVSERAMSEGRVEGDKERPAAWHPSKIVSKADYAAILDGASGSVVKGWLDNRQIVVESV